jgi:predicted transcriptional regulator
MRNRADWMVPADDKILEYLEVAGEVRPATIGRNVDITRDYAGLRVRELAQYDLVEPLDNSYYQITGTGEAYLEGKVNANELNKQS